MTPPPPEDDTLCETVAEIGSVVVGLVVIGVLARAVSTPILLLIGLLGSLAVFRASS
jgi:hypothetical protein